MWCDQAKSVWSRSNLVFFFLTNCLHHFHIFILQKTPLKLVNLFQRYEQLNNAKNNRKQKTFSALFGSILKSIFSTSDWFCLITSHMNSYYCLHTFPHNIVQRFSRAGPRGRGREWATLGVHPLSWLLSNNRLEKVPVVSVPHTSSNRLLLSNQDKGCTPSVAHSLPLPLGPALLNLSNAYISKAERLGSV